MANQKASYKVDFSIGGLTMKQQQEVFEAVIKKLDYNQRQNLHITITDIYGGKHFVWENYGISPNGTKCKDCRLVDCGICPFYMNEEKVNE